MECVSLNSAHHSSPTFVIKLTGPAYWDRRLNKSLKLLQSVESQRFFCTSKSHKSNRFKKPLVKLVKLVGPQWGTICSWILSAFLASFECLGGGGQMWDFFTHCTLWLLERTSDWNSFHWKHWWLYILDHSFLCVWAGSSSCSSCVGYYLPLSCG